MSPETNKRLNQKPLPAFLSSRAGWGRLFEMKRSVYPHLHQIEPTNVCPYNCIMCPRGEKMKRKTGYINFSTFTKIINEVASYPAEIKQKEIELFHFGESLLHPEICEMNELASSKGLNTVLSVNAIELTEKIAENLIKGEAGKIIVSIDGFDDESFLRIRGRKINFQEAIANVLRTSSLIKSLKRKTILVVRMIALKQNSHKIDDFKSFWKKNDIESEIRAFFPWGEEKMEELGEYEKYPPFMPCPFPWQYLVVQWNGDVVACCRDYNAENQMGNVNEESLEEIWNSSRYASFRESMIKGTYNNTICQPCMKLYYTE